MLHQRSCRGRCALLCALVLFGALLLAADAASTRRSSSSQSSSSQSSNSAKFDFRACGGPKLCLGEERLAAIARKSGKSHKTVDELAAELENDPDLGVDLAADMLLFVCAGMEVYDSATPQGVVPPAAGTPADLEGHKHHRHHHHRHLLQLDAPLLPAASEITSGWTPDKPDVALTAAQTFALHSRPGAAKKVMLDFDGYVTTGKAWNQLKGIDPINTPPFDKDGSPSTWSTDELADILAIWRSVAEDYSPFEVDVTTEDPGDAYLATNGARVAIGGAWSDWYGSAAGGIAYTGSFGAYGGTYFPAFIFPLNLGPNVAKYIADAVSHEVGHTLGLSHDGGPTSSYYSGQGYWGPIMGSPYAMPISQFSQGDYSGATNKEDDFAVINGYLPYVTDGYGSSLATATALTGTLNAGGLTATATAPGIIRGPTSPDFFAITAAAGTATLQLLVTPASTAGAARADLNATVTLLTAAGAVLKSTAGIGIAPFDVPLPAAGTYVVAVAPTGAGDPTTTGYSVYGSRGQYQLSVTYPYTAGGTPTPSPPPAVLPSPSPPPALPSPPPASPPPPSSNTMTITSVTNTAYRTSTSTTCTVVVTLVDSVTRLPLGGATVTGTWGSLKIMTGFPGFPYPASAITDAAAGGTARLTSKPLSPTKFKGNGCTFAVTAVSLGTYTLDAASVMQAPTARW